ncbi:MAG TPA: hypothetical protein VLH84_03155 [Patescibacteria group bacterium]|nr:hypothetical protein [Patescibacteria group bacterium]
MAQESHPDRPVDREAIVAGYSPEMVDAREALAARLRDIRERAKAADVTGTLPTRLAVQMYDNGVTVLDFGHLADDLQEALAQHRADKALGAMAMDLDGTAMPGSAMMLATFDDGDHHASEDSSFPAIEHRAIRLDWGDAHWASKQDNQTTHTALSIYRDGYAEYETEVTRDEYTHPPGADDMTKAYAEPIVRREVDVVPLVIRPAELADVQEAAGKVEGTLARYGLDQWLAAP